MNITKLFRSPIGDLSVTNPQKVSRQAVIKKPMHRSSLALWCRADYARLVSLAAPLARKAGPRRFSDEDFTSR